MNPGTDTNKAIHSANPKLLMESVSLPDRIPEILQKNGLSIRKEDQDMIIRRLSDVLLGIAPISISVDTIIEDAIDFEEVSSALGILYTEVFKGLGAELKTYAINTDPASQLFIENMFSQMPAGEPLPSFKMPTAQILSGDADEPIQDVPHTDAKQLLNEIENPTPSIARPEFVLPKSKPSTADILRGITPSVAESPASASLPAMTAPAASPISGTAAQAMGTSLADSLDLSTNTENIIDPFKPQAPTPSTTPNIGASMGNKLSGITGSATKESFKVVPLSEKARPVDPYREPIE